MYDNIELILIKCAVQNLGEFIPIFISDSNPLDLAFMHVMSVIIETNSKQ